MKSFLFARGCAKPTVRVQKVVEYMTKEEQGPVGAQGYPGDFFCARVNCRFYSCGRHPGSILREIAYYPELSKTTKFRQAEAIPELCRGKIADMVEEALG